VPQQDTVHDDPADAPVVVSNAATARRLRTRAADEQSSRCMWDAHDWPSGSVHAQVHSGNRHSVVPSPHRRTAAAPTAS
jgi:hypothetical protein